jgi:hypothetical protein
MAYRTAITTQKLATVIDTAEAESFHRDTPATTRESQNLGGCLSEQVVKELTHTNPN